MKKNLCFLCRCVFCAEFSDGFCGSDRDELFSETVSAKWTTASCSIGYICVGPVLFALASKLYGISSGFSFSVEYRHGFLVLWKV